MIRVLPYSVALDKLTDALRPLLQPEVVPTERAAGKIVASDVISPATVPDFDRSVVDGYAVYSADVAASSQSVPSVLRLAHTVGMGEEAAFRLRRGTCCYVPTGAMLPAGADAVVMIEDVERTGDEVFVSRPLRFAENVAPRGSDVARGSVIVRRGDRMNPTKLGACLAAGVTEVSVFRPLSFCLIATGDELVDPRDDCPIGKIREINNAVLSAQISDFGTVADAVRVKDDYDLLHQTASSALTRADIVVVSGGSSVGAADYTERLFASLGEVVVRGVAVKPGKPTVAATASNKFLLGLPGHPMAAFVAFRLLFLRALLRAAGSDLPPPVVCRAAINFAGGKGRAAVMPVSLTHTPEATLASPLFYQSGMISVIAGADGFAFLSEETEGVAKGDPLEVYLL